MNYEWTFFFFNLVDVSCCLFIKRWSCFLLSGFPVTIISLSLVLNVQLKCSHQRRLLCRIRNCCPSWDFLSSHRKHIPANTDPAQPHSVSQSRWGHVLVWWRSALHNPNHLTIVGIENGTQGFRLHSRLTEEGTVCTGNTTWFIFS